MKSSSYPTSLITNKEWFNELASDYLVGKILPIQNPTACSGIKVFFGDC